MSEALLTECFLCWRNINPNNIIENGNLGNNTTDMDKGCFKFNDSQIVNCKEYLQDEILSECKKQNNCDLSWDSKLFCSNCFEISESLTAVHEVFLEVQQQLMDIVELFNLEVLKERLIKSSSSVVCDGKSISEKNISETVENEKSQSKTILDFHEHLNNQKVQEQYKKEHFPPNCSNPQNTQVLRNGGGHKKKSIETTPNENILFVITSDTMDNLSDDFEIKEETLPSVLSPKSPLLKDYTNKNESHSNNSNIGTKSIEPAYIDENCIKNTTFLGKKTLVIKLTKLQIGLDGKVFMPSEPTLTTGGRIKRKAAISAIEVINSNKNNKDTTKDNGSNVNDFDIPSEMIDFDSRSAYESDDANNEQSNDNNKIKNKPSRQCSRKKEKILSSSHSCEKCGKMFKYESSVLQHQMRMKQCDVRKKRKDYFCKICNCTFPGVRKNSHIRFHTNSCQECGIIFSSTEDLRRHMKEKHIMEFNFHCDRCDEKFKVIQDLNTHKLQHTKEDFMSNCDRGEHYQCNICEQNFQKSDDLELFFIHMFSHGIYKCDHCNKKFDTRQFLKEHYSSEHAGGFLCHLCPVVNSTINGWKVHKREQHLQKNKKHVCEHCGSFYKRFYELKNHIIENHTEKTEKFFKCNQNGCDKAYVTKRQLISHCLSHTHKEKIICEVCGVKFVNISQHMETHNRIPYECKICGKKFKVKINMKTHMKVSHEGEKVECIICGQNFSSKASLTTHMLKHDDKRPFKCSECEKCFYRSDNLTTHMRSHTGEKPYKCNNCGKQFSRKDNLNTHVKKCPSSNKTSNVS